MAWCVQWFRAVDAARALRSRGERRLGRVGLDDADSVSPRTTRAGRLCELELSSNLAPLHTNRYDTHKLADEDIFLAALTLFTDNGAATLGAGWNARPGTIPPPVAPGPVSRPH